jgi:hypothetical protein
MCRQHRHRCQGQSLNHAGLGDDRQSAEQDVPDDLLIDLSDQ